MAAAVSQPALAMEGVSKRFPGMLAVDNVDLEVYPGEVHALMGENGAGKSTLMRILTGSFDDYTGVIRVGGREVTIHSPADAREQGIGMVYQELSLARPISIAENLLVGRLPTRWGGFIDRARMLREARAGMAVGAMNGLIVGRFQANPILWTLSVAFFMEGFMRFAWSNNQVYPDTAPGTPGAAFIGIFRLGLGPVPLVVIVMLLLFAIAHVVLTRTRFGRESRLVGSSRAAARSSGIRVSRVVFLNFLIAAFAASLAGIFLTSMNKRGVFYLGQGYDFKAVTAVVIGGVMLSGGRGHLPGVLGGLLVIGLLSNIMQFLGISAFR